MAGRFGKRTDAFEQTEDWMNDEQVAHPDAANSHYRSVNAAIRTVSESTSSSFDFFSTVIAGLALGLLIDWLANSGPIATIIGIVAGFVAGFYKLWRASAVLEEQAKQRRRL